MQSLSTGEICKTSKNPIFKCRNLSGIKLITRLKLGFSHLREHKFRYNFQENVNPIYSCGENIETSIHFLLHCPNYLNKIMTLLNNLQNVEKKFLIEIVPEFQRYSFSVILQLTMQKAQAF